MWAPWVIEELRTVHLKDKRLNNRLGEVLSQLAGHPGASIPAACGGYAETAAAYRLFDNHKVDFRSVLQPHVDVTRRRIAEQPVVIISQDTSEIDLTRPQQQVTGAGPLDGGPRRGVFLHPLHAFAPDGTPLGTLYARVWARDEQTTSARCETSAQGKQGPIQEKESQRSIEALRQAREEARLAPSTRIVCVADSQAEIYELLAEGPAEPREIEWIVRACRNRALQGQAAESSANYLRQQLRAQELLFRPTITVRGRKAKVSCCQRGRQQPRQSRKAVVEVRAGRVTLRPPWRPDRKLAPLSVNVMMVCEINPPPGEVPLEWILLTSLPIAMPNKYVASYRITTCSG